MKKLFHRMVSLVMPFVFAALFVPGTAFAAVHDAAEDLSSDTATIYLGKVLTVQQEDKFPNVNDFIFRMEPVRAWDNANENSSGSGKTIAVSAMPKPSPVSAAHQSVTLNGLTATITVGDFRGSTTTSVADTRTEKLRTTPVTIRFEKAGYYLYRVTETGSSPADVPGVTYDENSYYIVVYVCNRTDSEGNTIEGVYVHDITSYRNDPDSDVQPDLSDIQNVTDNGGIAALENAYENFEKVGKSTSSQVGTDPETGLPTGPNRLEAYRFWNDQTTHDVVITNNVTGNLGDITKEFEMTVTLTGLEKGVTYTTNVPAEEKDSENSTSQGADVVSASLGSVNASAKTFTADPNGNATFLIRLRDDEVLVLNALPATATYAVNEHATDHIASYLVTSTREEAVIAKSAEANRQDQKALSTAVETVDAKSNVAGRANADENDGTVTIAFTNHRNLATITGVPYYGDTASILMLGLAITACLILMMRRTRREE